MHPDSLAPEAAALAALPGSLLRMVALILLFVLLWNALRALFAAPRKERK